MGNFGGKQQTISASPLATHIFGYGAETRKQVGSGWLLTWTWFVIIYPTLPLQSGPSNYPEGIPLQTLSLKMSATGLEVKPLFLSYFVCVLTVCVLITATNVLSTCMQLLKTNLQKTLKPNQLGNSWWCTNVVLYLLQSVMLLLLFPLLPLSVMLAQC